MPGTPESLKKNASCPGIDRKRSMFLEELLAKLPADPWEFPTKPSTFG
jgi:hypothetical protein